MEQDPATGFDDWLAVRGAATAPPRMLAEGTRVGPWIVGGLLGRGGSGEVYHAEGAEGVSHAEAAEGAVALKVLHRSDAAAVERFRREAAILRDHPHPALPRFFGAGETADGRPWIAVEELERHELPHRDSDVAKLLLALCGGVAHLHAFGLVHRDVKPSNVLFRADGSPVLIDLGLAKRWNAPGGTADAMPPGASTLSVVDGRAVGVGTPGYAAPEQFSGGEVSPSADLYALGVLAGACFGGKPPRRWRGILRRATSALPGERYASAAAMARAIRLRRAPAFLAAAAGAAALAAAAAAAAHPGPKPPSPPASPSPADAKARALADRLVAEADPAWLEIASYSVNDGRVRAEAKLEGRHVSLASPLRLDGPLAVEIVGPGRLDAAISGTPEAHVSIRNAAVIDTTEDRNPLLSPRFRLGAGAFLAFPKIISLFPSDYAEPYAEPDPENPRPGDRAVRFSTPARSLAEQMELERLLLSDAAAVAAGDELVAAPDIGPELGWTDVVWTTSAATPWVVDAPGDGAVVGAIPGGIGETVLDMEIEDGDPHVVAIEGYYAGKSDHGGRGAVFEILSNGNIVFVDDRDRRPANGWHPIDLSFYPGRHHIQFRLRSDLFAPPGHICAVRLRLRKD